MSLLRALLFGKRQTESIIFKCQLDGGYDREKDATPLSASPDEVPQAELVGAPVCPALLAPLCLSTRCLPGPYWCWEPGPSSSYLTKIGQQHIWFSLAFLPLLRFPLSHCVSLVTDCWRCLDKSLQRDSWFDCPSA